MQGERRNQTQQHQKAQRISLCMIVKDEEELLPRCLESVRGAVDEIIVVDTGSSDRSVAIARKHGAMVVEFVWCDDFAAARNAGLELATGDWILFLDADEALDTAAREQIRSWTAVSGCDGLFLNIHNYTGSGQQGATVNPVLRLFRNAPEHRFTGRIHEQIAAAICERNPEAAFHVTDMVIHHYGYQTVIVELKDKVNRNVRLLQQAVMEEPNQPFHHYNLGVEYLRTGQAERALESFGKAREMIDPAITSYAHLLFKYEVRCLEYLHRWSEALARVDEALRLFPEYTDLMHHRAICADALGDTDTAELSLREAVRQGAPPAIFHTEEGMGTYQTWYTLGRLLEGKADLEGAVDAYVEAVRAKASLLPPLYRIFRIMRVSGQEQQIPALIASRFAMNSEEALTKVLGILEQSGCYAAALELLGELPPVSSGEPRERRSVAEAFLHVQRGDWRKARFKLETVKRKKGLFASLASRWLERLQWLEDEKGRRGQEGKEGKRDQKSKKDRGDQKERQGREGQENKKGQQTEGQDSFTFWLKQGSQAGGGKDVLPEGKSGLAGWWKPTAKGNEKPEEKSPEYITSETEHAGLYEGWQAFGLLLEGCARSGRRQELHGLIQRGQQLLNEASRAAATGSGESLAKERDAGGEEECQGNGEVYEKADVKHEGARLPFPGASDTLIGTNCIVNGLISAADYHLAQLMSDTAQAGAGQRQRHPYWPVIQHIRLELPGADGFEG
ncbi:glycosyltransferase [Paenibacillus barcinonensis]|uniref:tetratricopeptide repeat-containing glycosyltransferase family 2 protein n=1 Tax=Paenibacillus barcinonensis TaxID=198119 RepID=UPI001C1288D9|nr:glycosyltransferase family 2 protein [Paenibacillus barcinonensis]MBU5352838.1 glycosyltransferase [Paenibacillus barcinonensis]